MFIKGPAAPEPGPLKKEPAKMKKLNENQMKLVMTVLMTLYTVNCFFPVQNAVLYFYLSKPAVAWAGFAAAEGFRHTSDVRKYLMRLYVFAAIMFLGNIVLNTGFGTEKTFLGDNTFLTLALGVSSLCFFKKASHAEDRMQKTASFFAGAVSAAAGFAMQYGYLMIPVMVISAWCGNNFRKRDSMMILFSLLLFVLELQQGDSFREIAAEVFAGGDFLFVLLVPFLHIYDGTRGTKSPLIKYFFYIYYPAHIWITAIVMNLI